MTCLFAGHSFLSYESLQGSHWRDLLVGHQRSRLSPEASVGPHQHDTLLLSEACSNVHVWQQHGPGYAGDDAGEPAGHLVGGDPG